MSTLIPLCATAILALLAGLLLGRLSTAPTLRRLRSRVTTLQRIADYDRLTGLPNRYRAAKTLLVRQLRRQSTIVALIDLDRFKDVNDAWGHQAGDELLRSLAVRLHVAATVRSGIAARLGGDEFLLLLPTAGGDHSTIVAKALRVLEQPVILHTSAGTITVQPGASAGVTVDNDHHADLSDLLQQADIALYNAKQRRGTHQLYQPGLHMPVTETRHRRPRDHRPANQTDAGKAQP